MSYHTHKSFEAGTWLWILIDSRKVHRVIEFTQEAWLESNIDMYSELTTQRHVLGTENKYRKYFEKDLFKFISNSVFRKTMEM